MEAATNKKPAGPGAAERDAKRTEKETEKDGKLDEEMEKRQRSGELTRRMEK